MRKILTGVYNVYIFSNLFDKMGFYQSNQTEFLLQAQANIYRKIVDLEMCLLEQNFTETNQSDNVNLSNKNKG